MVVPIAGSGTAGRVSRAASLSGFGVSFNLFFDRTRVTRAIDKWTNRVLIRYGGYARRVMRSNQRSGGKNGTPSQPGEFPRAQEGSIRRLTFFAFDEAREGVLTGPLGFTRVPKGYAILSGQQTIPEVLNEGGDVAYSQPVAEKSRRARFSRIRGRKSRNEEPKRKRSKRRRLGVARRSREERYRIEARPFIKLTRDIVVPEMSRLAGEIPLE